MEQYNTKLNELTARIARRRKLKAMVDDLEHQRSQLAAQVQALKERTYKEQLDVDRLEGLSAANIFYRITGKLDEKLEQEEAEVCAVALQYETRRRELEAVERDLSDRREEWRTLQSCEQEYADLLSRKKQAMKEMNSYYGDQICALEERIAYLDAQEKELREAVSAGESALSDVEDIQHALSSAEGWGTFDMLGGGLLSDIAKHAKLDEAQRQIQDLQRSLSRFRTELADVAVQASFQIQVDGFLRFADYFFDDVFSSWAVMDRIRQSKDQVADVERSIENILDRLEQSLTDCGRERAQKKRELDELVLKA